MKLIVYHDDNYPTHWISRQQSKRIANYFKNKNFKEYNAKELSKFMEKSIDEDSCWQSVILFSQDLVPETVCHLPFPSSLIRNYLDHGGTIVWIGDVPFYYIGLNSSRTRNEHLKLSDKDLKRQSAFRDNAGKLANTIGRSGCFATLGTIPIWLNYPVSKVNITKKGRKLGLETPWYSNRPILIRGLNLRGKKAVVLAESKSRYLMRLEKSVLSDEPERKIPFASFFDFMLKLIGLVPALITTITAILSLLAGFERIVTLSLIFASGMFLIAYIGYWFFWSREKLASAWLKNFDERHPKSGFVRLWDVIPHRITDKMLEELYSVALARVERKTSSENSNQLPNKKPKDL